MTSARSFFGGLWGTLTGQSERARHPSFQTQSRWDAPHCQLHGYAAGDHRSCVINTGPYCNEPVTQGQIDEGDAHPIDERGVNDGKYEHAWCVQGGK